MSEDFPVLAGFGVGSLVAGYRLEAQVGAGGSAVVFRARDERLGRLVALKILAPALAADAAFRRRFIAESRAAAAVDDPHIIPVHEAGEAGGLLFIAMRFVAGGDLRGVLDREGALPPGRAAGFISPVAWALDAAHRAGLVHRDVKPANILVDSREGRPDHVYVSDFGVSKGAVSTVGLTGAGQFLGTPAYSAPEQIQGRMVDGRADQYALACVTYQLLTGVAPFERDQAMAVLLAHLHEPPPTLGSRRPDLPAAADLVLARAMAKAPRNRYGSCRDFTDALRAALGLVPYYVAGSAVPADPAATIAAAAELDVPGPAAARVVASTRREEDMHREEDMRGQEAAPPAPKTAAVTAPSPASAGHPAVSRRRLGRPQVVAGQLAIAGAALLVAGLFVSGVESPFRLVYPLYVAVVAVCALTAAACLLRPATSWLVGAGLLLGIAAAVVWGLLLLVIDSRDYLPSGGGWWKSVISGGYSGEYIISEGNWWLEFAGLLILVLAACLAGFMLARSPEVRLILPRRHIWLLALLGAAGALALVLHDTSIWDTVTAERWWVVPSAWATGTALVVPVCAAAAAPRGFGVALLAGWLASGTALLAPSYTLDDRLGVGNDQIVAFGVTLAALLAVTVLSARASAGSGTTATRP